MNHHPQSQLRIWDNLRVSDCVQCALHKGVNTVCLLGDGPVPAEGMVVSDAPGYTEDQKEIPLSGKSGIFLRKMLKDVGIDPRLLYMTSVVACRPPANREPSRNESKICSSLYLRPQIDRVKPKAILLLGNVALAWALGKKGAITKAEGSTLIVNGISCIPSRSPSSVIRLEEYDRNEFVYAAQKFRENLLLFRKTLHPEIDTFPYERNLRILKDTPKGEPLYTDIETNGLNPCHPNAKIHCLSVSRIPSRVASVRFEGENIELGKKLLREHPLIVHRGTFEGTWYYKHLGVLFNLYHDTKFGAFAQDESDRSGLKYQAVRHLGVEPWSEEQDWEDPDFDKLLPYNARDNQYGHRLYRERDLPFLKNNLKVARLLRYIILPAQEAFTKAIINGVHIDMDEAKKRMSKVEKEKKRLNGEINDIAGREINPGSSPQMSKLLYVQLKLKCPVMTKGGKKSAPKPSTAEAALIRLRGMHPVTDKLWDWRGWDKKGSTYLLPWISKGPIVHFNYGFTDTDTGRLNSTALKNKRNEKKLQVTCPFCSGDGCKYCAKKGKKPEGILSVGHGATVHQCPREGFIRNLITPRGCTPGQFLQYLRTGKIPPIKKDWVIVAADLSQVELRLVAHASGDKTMCHIFNSGGDIHLETAKELAESDDIDKETRKKAKAVNFGFVYGMWAKKFGAYALEKFDLKLTNKESTDYRNKFFNKYDGLLPWHNRVEALVVANGFIDSVFGRRRHLPSAMPPYTDDCPDCKQRGKIIQDCFFCGGEGVVTHGETEEWVRREAIRQAINSPIQSAGSDLCLWIAALMNSRAWHDEEISGLPEWEFQVDEEKAFFIGSAHDSQLYECHIDYVKELRDGIKYTVANLPVRKYFGFEFRVPIEMDVAAYPDCWEGKEMTIQ